MTDIVYAVYVAYPFVRGGRRSNTLYGWQWQPGSIDPDESDIRPRWLCGVNAERGKSQALPVNGGGKEEQ